jgi:hypothetical protein
MENDKAKEKWFPGKYLAKARGKKGEGGGSSADDVDDRRPQSLARTGSFTTGREPDPMAEGTRAELYMDTSPSDAKVIGRLTLNIAEIKYLRMNGAKMTVQLDQCRASYYLDGSTKSFERVFDLVDIVSDVLITISGKNDNGEQVTGIVVIPVSSLLGFSGSIAAPKEQWRQLYPISVHRIKEKKPFKFVSGFVDLPGFAMSRTKEPLGFICTTISLELLGGSPSSAIAHYCSKGSINWKYALYDWMDQVRLQLHYSGALGHLFFF